MEMAMFKSIRKSSKSKLETRVNDNLRSNFPIFFESEENIKKIVRKTESKALLRLKSSKLRLGNKKLNCSTSVLDYVYLH